MPRSKTMNSPPVERMVAGAMALAGVGIWLFAASGAEVALASWLVAGSAALVAMPRRARLARVRVGARRRVRSAMKSN